MTTVDNLPASAVTELFIPKEKFYQTGGVSPSVKRYFIDEVDRVTLCGVVAPRTMNISADIYEEMHIIKIDLKSNEINTVVLQSIDSVIPRPLLFVLVRSNGEKKYSISYKELKPREVLKSKVIQYYQTPWGSSSLKVTGNSVRSIYVNFIRQIEPDFDLAKPIAEAVKDTQLRQRLRKQIVVLNKQIANEPSIAKRQELARQRYDLEQLIQKEQGGT